MNAERVLTGLAVILTVTLGGALVRRVMTPAPVAPAAPVARIELTPAERAASQAARKADARATICRTFENVKQLPAGVTVTPETAAQHYRYLDAIAADADTWQLDAPIRAGLALMRNPATDAREYWRAAAIVSGTCDGGAR